MLLIVTLALFFLSLIGSSLQSDGPDMILEVFRHGARSPLDESIDKYWTNSGELTAVGERMHYILGRVLAEKYPKVFADFSLENVHVISTDLNRTIMSANSQLYGIFEGIGGKYGNKFPIDKLSRPPFDDEELVNKSMDKLDKVQDYLPFAVQPVPVHVLNDEENLLLSFKPVGCPKSADWLIGRQNDSVTRRLMNQVNKTIEFLESKNYSITSVHFELFGDVLESNIAENISFPFNISYLDEHYNATTFFFQTFTMHLYAGVGNETTIYQYRLLNRIYDEMNNFVNNNSPIKASLFSAHDTTLAGLLSAFGVVTMDCIEANYNATLQKEKLPYPLCEYPYFAANIIFELYNTSEPYFSVYYNNRPIPICGHKESNNCTLLEFRKYIDGILDGMSEDKLRERCGIVDTIVPNDKSQQNNDYFVTASITGIIFVALLLYAIYIISNTFKSIREGQQNRDIEKPLSYS